MPAVRPYSWRGHLAGGPVPPAPTPLRGPAVPSTTGPKDVWAFRCPNPLCDTELVVFPEYAGEWVECPTCGLRFIAPRVVPILAVPEKEVARPSPPRPLKTDGVAEAEPPRPATAAGASPTRAAPRPAGPAVPRGGPAQRRASTIAQALDGLAAPLIAEPVALSSPAAAPQASPAPLIAKPVAALKRPAAPKAPSSPETFPPHAAKAAGGAADWPKHGAAETLDALDSLARLSHEPGMFPAPARTVSAPASRAAGDLKRRKAPRVDFIPPVAEQAAQVVRTENRTDLVLTWIVSLLAAGAIILAAWLADVKELGLGAIPFIGLPILRTVLAFQRGRGGLPPA